MVTNRFDNIVFHTDTQEQIQKAIEIGEKVFGNSI